MIDIHSHILPGLDDGASDIYETLKMAEIAVESGVTQIVATPHCNVPGVYDNYFGDTYINVYDRVVEAVAKAGMPLQILPGTEAFATHNLPDLIVDKKIMPLNQSRYILMEFSFDENPDYAKDILKRVKAVGAKPVIAHAERYEFIQDNPRIVLEWMQEGYTIQVNKGSFVGRFGEKARNTAFLLMDNDLISVVASDAHGAEFRTPVMSDVYGYLKQFYKTSDLNRIFYENPRRICNNESVLRTNVMG